MNPRWQRGGDRTFAHRGRRGGWAARRLAGVALLLALLLPAASAEALPAGFSESTVFQGLELPTAVRFAPGGQVIVAEKSGLIKVFDSLSDPSPTVAADLRTEVYNSWDRGLLGIALDPAFATNRYLYALYTRNAPIGATPPYWPAFGGSAEDDDCPGPVQPPDPAQPGPLTDGCLVSGRLVRLQLSANLHQVVAQNALITNEWCQQFPSHSVGSMAFDQQGNLLVSAGDGAIWGDPDWGQHGLPRNPCGDPPGGVGANLTPPTAEGGAARSQDLRTSGDPTGLDGAILRLNPATGAPATGNPLSGPDENARRIIAYGFRNPFRIAVRPGTSELWVGDVGSSNYEEINRLPPITAGAARNFGWPCFESSIQNFSMLGICQGLYAETQPLQMPVPPVFAYRHGQPAMAGDTCTTGSSSTSGLAFEQGNSFPSRYDGALFFSDYSRSCIWVMRDTNGDSIPDAGGVESFRPGAIGPVDLQFGPGGSLYYADIAGGEIRRISTGGPTAVASATPSSGPAPLDVTLSGAGSSDPGDPQSSLDFDWDLDEDGGFDDAHGLTVAHTYDDQGSYVARLRVTDPDGNEGFDSATIDVGNGPPVPVISSPLPGVKWTVGETIAFSGSATDPEQGNLPASALDWEINLRHCPADCHTHFLAALQGEASGSFVAPPHEYPSHLELTLEATDAFGRSASTSLDLDPRTSRITVATTPPGLTASLGEATGPTPLAATEIVGSSHTVSTVAQQGSWLWESWSDGGDLTHSVVAGPGDRTVTAEFGSTALAPGPDPGSGPQCHGLPATIVGTAADEVLSGTNGTDSVVAGSGDDRIKTRGGDDVVCAGAGDDVVRGGSREDSLRGGADDDLLVGGGGADELAGGAGADRCPGAGTRDKRSGCSR